MPHSIWSDSSSLVLDKKLTYSSFCVLLTFFLVPLQYYEYNELCRHVRIVDSDDFNWRNPFLTMFVIRCKEKWPQTVKSTELQQKSHSSYQMVRRCGFSLWKEVSGLLKLPTQFNYVLTAIDPRVVTKIRDILMKPLKDNPYTALV